MQGAGVEGSEETRLLVAEGWACKGGEGEEGMARLAPGHPLLLLSLTLIY